MFWNCEIDFRFKSSRKILQSRDQMVPQCKDGGKIDTSEPECREDWPHPGQDAVKSAGEFHHRMDLTGVVLSKMDGDARGGAALSVVSVVGVPVVFSATGERLDDIVPFDPDSFVHALLSWAIWPIPD